MSNDQSSVLVHRLDQISERLGSVEDKLCNVEAGLAEQTGSEMP